jgi:hypothetical protein
LILAESLSEPDAGVAALTGLIRTLRDCPPGPMVQC